MFAQVAGEFENAGSRKRARAYVLGLLSQRPERKNGWTLAEFAGNLSPDGMQRLLNFYAGDAGAVRDARCAGTWSGAWATRPRCWRSTRPVPEEGPDARLWWPGSTPGPRAG